MLWGFCCGEVKSEFTADAGNTSERHAATVKLGDLLYHRQAQSRSTVPAARRIHLIESLPDFFLLILRNTDAVVAHRQRSLVFILTKRYVYAAVGLSIFICVVQQVLKKSGQ